MRVLAPQGPYSRKQGQQIACHLLLRMSAVSAASRDYVKFQAVIKSAACAASLCGGRGSGRLDHDLFFMIFGRTELKTGASKAKFDA